MSTTRRTSLALNRVFGSHICPELLNVGNPCVQDHRVRTAFLTPLLGRDRDARSVPARVGGYFGLLCVVWIALGLAGVAAAEAQTLPDPDYWKLTADNRDTVSRFVYSQSPQAIPTGYSPVAEAEGYLREAQRTLPPSNPQVPSLWQNVRGVTSRVGLSAAPRVLGTVGLSVGTFEVGWKIGTGINAKWLRLGLPPATDGPEFYRWSKIVWTPANQRSYYGAIWPATAGWLIWMQQKCCLYKDAQEWFNEPCTFSGFTPPAPFEIVGPLPTTATCGTSEPPGYANVSVYYGYAPEQALAAPGPIESYTNQAFSYSTPAPTPPPQATVEDSIEDELDAPENDLLRQWLNYTLGSPGEEDPLGIGDPNPEIEFPNWFEHWEDHGDAFSTPYDDPFEYWRDATDIVERGENGDEDIMKCTRTDKATIYWDPDKEAIVIVKDGKIVTYFPPDTGFDYFVGECSK